MGTGLWGIGFSIVNARLKKTLKLMVATPDEALDYLLSQMLSRFVFLIVEVGSGSSRSASAAFQVHHPRLARRPRDRDRAGRALLRRHRAARRAARDARSRPRAA
jgi:hypothetical protein